MSSGTLSDNAMLLNLQMLTDPMDELIWDFTVHRASEKPSLRNCQLYFGQESLLPDTVYVIPEEYISRFPADQFCYITPGALEGSAPHIRSVRASFGELFNLVLSTFQRYYDFENRLGCILAQDGSLTELCFAASEFFHNPVYIHDDLFSVIAHSRRVEGMLEFEYNERTDKLHIPLWLIEEFKFDKSYTSTLSLHHASIWGNDQYPYSMRSLFVNIWDDQRYCGRLLINEIASSLLPGQFYAAEYVGRYVTVLLQHLRQRKNLRHRNFEETLIALMTGEEVDARDLHTVLRILDWSETDQYLCLKLRNQDANLSIRSDSALHGLLSSILQGCVIFHHQQELCILVNINQHHLDPLVVRQKLAPHIRDSCMHCGISNPVDGIRAIRFGFSQADMTLHYITQEEGSDWIMFFSNCALNYVRDRSCQEMPRNYLVHPVLLDLKHYDQNNGTQYYDTLRAFLLCERNIPVAANALIIHRTTLTYRLGKIQELVKLNLNDERLRLYLLLSFYLLEQ